MKSIDDTSNFDEFPDLDMNFEPSGNAIKRTTKIQNSNYAISNVRVRDIVTSATESSSHKNSEQSQQPVL